jgi:hypothetical protein
MTGCQPQVPSGEKAAVLLTALPGFVCQRNLPPSTGAHCSTNVLSCQVVITRWSRLED